MWESRVSAPCVEIEECVRRLAGWKPASVHQALAIMAELVRMSTATPARTSVMVRRYSDFVLLIVSNYMTPQRLE